MRPSKFNFIPERQLNKVSTSDNGLYVTITKQKNMLFNKSDVDIYELDGKYVRLFVDTEKKSIGWAVIENKTELEALNDARQLKKNPKSGTVLVGVGRLLKSMGIDPTENRKYPVNTYKSMLQTHDIKYIELALKEADGQ